MSERKRLGLIFISDEQWIGGTYYTINLIHALNTLNEVEKPEIVAFSNPIDFDRLKNETHYPFLKYELLDDSPHTGVKIILQKVFFKFFKWKILVKKFKGNLDALFILQRSEYLESVPFEKRIYWIPDFQDKHYPKFFTEAGLLKKHNTSQWIADHAKQIILSSDAVKKDWETYYPNYKGKSTVVHFAVTHPEYTSLDFNELLRKYQLPDRYFFAPNQFWAHKNHMVLIQAAELLKNMRQPVVVAFSGKENDNRNPGYTENLKKYVHEKDLGDVVRFLGFLDRREQLKLMSESIAVIQPSLFEGWSTVIEDAMAMNKTVIASDLEVNIEQLGDKGIFFDKTSAVRLSEVLNEIILNPKSIQYDYTTKKKYFAKSLINSFFIDSYNNDK